MKRTVKVKPITYSKTIGVYPLPRVTPGEDRQYARLCDVHAVARGLEGIARTGVAAAVEPAECEDCNAQRLLDAIKVAE